MSIPLSMIEVDEHVGVAAQEAEHALLEHLLVHLPVRDLEAHRRAEGAQPLGGLVDVLDAVVQEERLAAARACSRSSACLTSCSSYSPT